MFLGSLEKAREELIFETFIRRLSANNYVRGAISREKELDGEGNKDFAFE